MAIVEGTRVVAHEAAHVQTEGVAPQGDIERAVALDVELAPLLARCGEFAQHVEAEDAAHGLEQLSSHTDAVLVVLLRAGGEMRQCELVAVEVMAGKEAESSLHPGVETFAEFEGHGVGYVQVLGIVVGGIARQVEVVEVGGRGCVLPFVGEEKAVVVVHAQGVEDAADGHELGRGGCDGVERLRVNPLYL